MPTITKIYTRALPELTLVGEPCRDSDRNAEGSFSHRWAEWFTTGRFDELERCGECCPDTGYVGAMRMCADGFEYWIGMLMTSVERVPEGMQAVPVRGGEYGVAWLKGEDGPELYSMHEQCMQAFAERSMRPAENGWYIENYVCPRFTTPDENGEIILDYVVQLAPPQG